MTGSFKQIATRLVIANLLVVPVLFLLIMLTSSNVAAESVSGTWTSNTSGKGYVQNFNVFNANYDAKLVLNQDGNAVSGTFKMTCSYSKLNPGYAGWSYHQVGDSGTFAVTGTMSGSTLTISAPTGATWVLHMNGNKMTGSGTYTSGGITYSYIFDLTSGGGSGLALSGQVTVPAAIAIIGGAVCLGASLMPAPKGMRSHTSGSINNMYNYQPSEVRTTGGDSGAPTESTYMGGAGLSYPQDYVNGVPKRPSQWQSQQGPLCPIHGTICQAHLISVGDPGAWFCPKCRDQGRGAPPGSGFPWGRQ